MIIALASGLSLTISLSRCEAAVTFLISIPNKRSKVVEDGASAKTNCLAVSSICFLPGSCNLKPARCRG